MDGMNIKKEFVLPKDNITAYWSRMCCGWLVQWR